MIPAGKRCVSRADECGLLCIGYVKPCFVGFELANAFSLEVEAMCAMDEPVQHGIGDGGIADVLMPMIDGYLAGDDGRGPVVPIIDDFHQVTTLFGGQRGDRPVVQDQELDAGEVLEHSGVTAVTAGDAEPLQQPGHALIEHGPIIAAGAVAESTGQPGFPRAGLPGDEQILVAFDPFTARQFLEQSAIGTAGGAVIDILGCRLLAEACEAKPGCQTFAVSLEGLALDQHGHAVLKAVNEHENHNATFSATSPPGNPPRLPDSCRRRNEGMGESPAAKLTTPIIL